MRFTGRTPYTGKGSSSVDKVATLALCDWQLLEFGAHARPYRHISLGPGAMDCRLWAAFCWWGMASFQQQSFQRSYIEQL
jgi:hypothetical protein